MSVSTAVHLADLFRALRPRQWVKNSFVFAALVFGDQAGDPRAVLLAVTTFVLFCGLSSSVYLLNDIVDRESDRAHPLKRDRPVAAGRVSVGQAAVLSLVLGVGSLIGCALLHPGLALVAGTYLSMNVAYSFWLKQVVILDVMLVSAGFLLRALAGGVVLGVHVSNWLVLCTGLIALFLATIKRRQELAASDTAERQRPILREYSLPFLDQMISILSSATIVVYCLYGFSRDVITRVGPRGMAPTIPFVLFGIFRYLYLVYQRGDGENPTRVVLRDRPLLVAILLWGATVIWVLYAE